MKQAYWRAGLVGVGLVLTTIHSATANDVEEFYKGKQINYVVGLPPGGSYDGYARLLARHIGRHIPGKPLIVVQNMAGAGSRTATNWLYSVARKDGSVLGTVSQSIPMDQRLQEDEGVQFDVRRFHWIGNMFESNSVLVVWHTSGVKTIDDAKTREVAIAGTGPNAPDTLYPRVANALLGTKFRVITGYTGGAEMDLAMERGEVGGRGSNSWQTMKYDRADWLREKKIHMLFQVGSKQDPELPHVPLLADLGTSALDRQILEFVSSNLVVGRSVLTTPEVPADRVAALRKAFAAALHDAEFLAEAEKQKMTINATQGEELQAIVERNVSVSAEVIARIKALQTK